MSPRILLVQFQISWLMFCQNSTNQMMFHGHTTLISFPFLLNLSITVPFSLHYFISFYFSLLSGMEIKLDEEEKIWSYVNEGGSTCFYLRNIVSSQTFIFVYSLVQVSLSSAKQDGHLSPKSSKTQNSLFEGTKSLRFLKVPIKIPQKCADCLLFLFIYIISFIHF